MPGGLLRGQDQEGVRAQAQETALSVLRGNREPGGRGAQLCEDPEECQPAAPTQEGVLHCPSRKMEGRPFAPHGGWRAGTVRAWGWQGIILERWAAAPCEGLGRCVLRVITAGNNHPLRLPPSLPLQLIIIPLFSSGAVPPAPTVSARSSSWLPSGPRTQAGPTCVIHSLIQGIDVETGLHSWWSGETQFWDSDWLC